MVTNSRLTRVNVEAAFRLFCDEARAGGVDCSDWVMESTWGPSSWRILGVREGSQYVPALLPNSGYLGGTMSQAYDRLTFMREGMRMVRFTAEDKRVRS